VKVLMTIAVGYDESPDAVIALQWAARLASQCHARLKVLHSVGLLEHAGLADLSSPHRDDVMQIAMKEGLDHREFEWVVVDGDPCSAMLRLIATPPAVDLLVVGSRGMGHHSGTVLGSTSLELVEHSTVPVVVVPRSSFSMHGAKGGHEPPPFSP
jgi:nucleotide-binding universal stress UspA family protein